MKEYKGYKGLRKESLRDNMSDLEVMLADIGEITTRKLTIRKENSNKLKFIEL